MSLFKPLSPSLTVPAPAPGWPNERTVSSLAPCLARGGDTRSNSVLVLHNEAELAPHVPAWRELARSALEPNAFHEPWMMLPALRAFAAGEGVFFVLVYGHAPRQPAGRPVLCGLFPLHRRRLSRALPLRVVGLWKHLYCFLDTPLVRADCAAPTLAALFDWLYASPLGGALLQFDAMTADGPFARALLAHCNAALRPTFVVEAWARACLEPRSPDAQGAEAYLHEAMAGKRLKDLRRKERALGGAGRLDYRVLGQGEDPAPWVESFLRLEASGWKGTEGSAMACRPENAAFFREMTQAAAEQGRLQMLGLFRDGQPLALKCNLLAPPGGYAFKIAFDEAEARNSPGVLLEVYTLEHLHRQRSTRWLDSCAVPNHPMIDRLWLERRMVQSLLVATGRRFGDLALSALPLARWLKRKFARRRAPAPAPSSEEGGPS